MEPFANSLVLALLRCRAHQRLVAHGEGYLYRASEGAISGALSLLGFKGLATTAIVRVEVSTDSEIQCGSLVLDSER